MAIPPLLWSSFSELSEVLSPGLQSSFCPQIKLKSPLTCCAFLKSTVLGDQPSYPEGTGALVYDQRPLIPLCLLGESRQICIGEQRSLACCSHWGPKELGQQLLVLGSPILVDNPEFYLVVE